jgi:nitric oxide reductase subunit B
MFSFIEVLPLVLLILEAISQHRLIKASSEFNYGLAYTFILGSAFWNFVGAGVFGGGTLNAPLVNYYEHGTFLTLNHAHTSLFGHSACWRSGSSTSVCVIAQARTPSSTSASAIGRSG